MGYMNKKALWLMMSGSSAAAVSAAAGLLAAESQGLAFDFTDSFFQSSTGFYGSARIKDTGTPANEFNSSLDAAASSLLTYTSPSVKMTMGPSGTLRYGAHNLFLQSSGFSTASWSKSNVTATADQLADSAGSVSADLITLNGSTGVQKTVLQTVTFPGGERTISVEAKTGTHQYIQLAISNGTQRYANFDIINGTVGTTGSAATSSILSLGNGWYRCTLVCTPTVASTDFYLSAVEASSATFVPTISTTGTTFYLARAHGRANPSDSTFLSTTSAARYSLPYQWTSAGVLEGILVEEARTQAIYPSQQFANAGGGIVSNTNSGSCTSTETAPDGTATGTLLTSNGGTESGWRVTGATIYLINTTYTASCYVKYGTARYAYMRALCFAGGLAQDGAWFDLQNGVVATKGTGWTSTFMTSVGNGWYRIGGTFTSPGTISSQLFDLRSGNADAATTSTNGQTAAFWGVQLETGAFVTSYIQNLSVTSTVTRAADNISLATSAFPYAGSSHTLYLSATTSVQAAASRSCIYVDLGANEASRVFLYDSGGLLNYGAKDASSSAIAALTVAASAPSTTFNSAFGLATNDMAFYRNGTSVGTDTSGTPGGTANTLRLGSDYTSSAQFNGYIKKIMYLPRRMTNAELVTLTTP